MNDSWVPQLPSSITSNKPRSHEPEISQTKGDPKGGSIERVVAQAPATANFGQATCSRRREASAGPRQRGDLAPGLVVISYCGCGIDNRPYSGWTQGCSWGSWECPCRSRYEIHVLWALLGGPLDLVTCFTWVSARAVRSSCTCPPAAPQNSLQNFS